MSLNPSQLEVVQTLSGPLLVLAGAGSGKTRVVTYRIAALIKHGTPPERILAVTFTNKAASEMQQRAAALLGKRLKQRPHISTFHSLCVRILRRRATLLGYPAQFAIYDRGDQESLARSALRELRVAETVLRPGDLLAAIGNWKSHAVRPPQASSQASTDKEHLASAAYRRYQEALVAAGAMDFDDLLLVTEDLFSRYADVRREEAARFAHLLIDEYQDTNASQYRIVKALAQGHRNLCVVGDDDQSIYGWRGADVTHILRFKQDWPEAKVVRLEENYRSTAAILELANRLIAHNPQRHEKQLRAMRGGGEKPAIMQCQSETEEAQRVVGDIAERLQQGLAARDVAILLRTGEQSRPFEEELRRKQVPYVVVGGMSFYDRKEVRDITAYLKLCVQPSDEVALRRIINIPPRGLGQKAVAQLQAQAVADGKSMWDTMAAAEHQAQLAAAALEGIRALRELVTQFQHRPRALSLVDAAKLLLEGIDYQAELARVYKEPLDQQARWATVQELINGLAAYEQRASEPSLAEYLDELALGERDDESDKDEQLQRNAVALLTMHSAKGLEFPHVYLVGLEEGLLPHHRAMAAGDAAICEERRLCYVGVTRAQDRLTLSLALSRMKWGKPRPTVPSQFLFEIVGEAERGAQVRAKAAQQQAAAVSGPRGSQRGTTGGRRR